VQDECAFPTDFTMAKAPRQIVALSSYTTLILFPHTDYVTKDDDDESVRTQLPTLPQPSSLPVTPPPLFSSGVGHARIDAATPPSISQGRCIFTTKSTSPWHAKFASQRYSDLQLTHTSRWSLQSPP